MDLLEMSERCKALTSELLHGNVNVDSIEMQVIDTITTEILNELGDKKESQKIKLALRNMFFLGQIFSNNK